MYLSHFVRSICRAPLQHNPLRVVTLIRVRWPHLGVFIPSVTCCNTPRSYGYGAYGCSCDPGFGAAILSLLDRGLATRQTPLPQ